MKYLKSPALFVSVVIFLSVSATSAQKMKVEDIVAKHLDSIGTSEARAAVKTQVAVGDAQVKLISNITTPVVGRLVMASAGEKNFWGTRLNALDYQSENLSYDGNKVKVGYTRLGNRSTLGSFVLSNNSLLERGLLGGTLSNSWAMLNLADGKAKISYSGTKKINGKDAYVLDYLPKGGSDIDANK